MPLNWNFAPGTQSRSQLLETRRLEKIPHPSFDLDKDGKVGGQDLVISKLFDRDRDGRLNEAERGEAERALSQGVLDKFVWGVEQSGPSRAYRIVQKRGVIVDQEDFSGLRDTYPHVDRPKLEVCTTTQLRHQRAQDRLKHLQTQRETWDLLHPYTVEQEKKEYPKTSTLSYRSMSEKMELEGKKKRVKAGLAGEVTEVSEKKPPSLEFVDRPRYPSKSLMDADRKAEMLGELYAKKNFEHVNGDQRLLEREAKLITIVPEGHKGRTYRDVKEQMRRETNEGNVEKFSNVVIGIHGQELPKFTEHNPEYYKSLPGYNAAPSVTSSIELHQQRKFWAPPDPYKTTDKDESMPPPDPFKRTYVRPEVKKEELPEKPNNHHPTPYEPRDPSEMTMKPRKLKYRWTTLVHYFAQGSVFAPMKDPEIEQVDEVSVEEKKE